MFFIYVAFSSLSPCHFGSPRDVDDDARSPLFPLLPRPRPDHPGAAAGELVHVAGGVRHPDVEVSAAAGVVGGGEEAAAASDFGRPV